MQVINLYRYTRPDGGVTVSPEMADTEYTVMYRLIADEGMSLTQDGVEHVSCVDTESTDGWKEEERDVGISWTAADCGDAMPRDN